LKFTKGDNYTCAKGDNYTCFSKQTNVKTVLNYLCTSNAQIVNVMYNTGA